MTSKKILLKAILTIQVIQIKDDLYCVEFIEAAYKLIPGQSDTARVHRLWTERGGSFKRQLLKDKTQLMFFIETKCIYLV